MAREGQDSFAGFPGVRRLFARAKFPGTIKQLNSGAESNPDFTGVQRPQSGISGRDASASNLACLQEASVRPNDQGNHPGVSASSSTMNQTSVDSREAAGSGSESVSKLRSMSSSRIAKFEKVLSEPVVDIEALKELAWSGVPPKLRPDCWRILLGYAPPNRERRRAILARKRQEYRDFVPSYFEGAGGANASEDEVSVDVPRTAPGVPFFSQVDVQSSLERILYIWGLRHPASGYVQGINDLVTPFLAVFASEHFEGPMNEWRVGQLPAETLLAVEADCYWCLSRLLDGIQDHYTHAQPGIQRAVFHLRELVRRVDERTASHLNAQGIEFLQFAFRWVNCLLLREVPFPLGIRLWDTYLAEGSGLREFLVYILGSFLLSWSSELQTMEFQELIMFLQRPPTTEWGEEDIELVLSRAFMWRSSFKGATKHFAC